MSIIRLEDKYKSRNELQLHPRRRFVSSSSGITGSLYVFPNRSETQKDNIDERLALFPLVDSGASNWDGSTPDRADIIRPYDGNSLEARRKEIYEGNFSKLTVSPFTDATQYEYIYTDTTDNSNDGTYTGEDLNDLIFQEQSIVPTIANPSVVTAIRISDNLVFNWSSAGYWINPNGQEIYRRIPESDRDKSSVNYEVPLALLLDGANPYTREHAWRSEAKQKGELADLYELYQNDPTNPDYAEYAQYQTYYDQGWRSGNSSYTNTPNPELYQFSGNSVIYDEFDNPYVGSPISKKEDLNVWPPEIDKWDIAVNTNWILQGYSDLSMHPRNKTQKNIKLSKGTGDHFEKQMVIQRQLFNRMKYISIEHPHWSVRNYNALSLSSYEDLNGDTKSPCLAYRNENNQYTIDWDASDGGTDAVTFEFWIKPTKEQTSPGTICHLPSNHAIVLLPDESSLANGTYSRYKIGVYVQNSAAISTQGPSSSDVTISGVSNSGIYVTDAVFQIDNWHHVAIRWSENFNNGLLAVYVDGKLESSNTEDGIYAGSRTGLVNTALGNTSPYTYTIGGWQSYSFTNIFGYYAAEQNLKTLTTAIPSFTTGYGVDASFQLKSELCEFRIWNVAKTNLEINNLMNNGLSSTENLRCYIPFLFDPYSDTPQFSRKVWIPDTNAEDKASYYKNAVSAKVGGSTGSNPAIRIPICSNNGYLGGISIVYVHSYLQDVVNEQYPVITSMPDFSDSATFPDPDGITGDLGELIHIRDSWQNSSALRTLNTMIIPCDNGKLIPNYTLNRKEFNVDYSPEWIQLASSGVGQMNSYSIGKFLDDETFVIDDIISIDPDKFDEDSSQTTMEQYRTSAISKFLRDEDFCSPVSSVIEIPQLYYGNEIQEGSIVLKCIHNKDGKKITLKDYRGSLYRMDSKSRKRTSKVGLVDYHNGVICIFHPLITSVGIDNFELEFSGTKNMHVLQLDIPCSSGVANLSANSGYKKLKASSNANETDGNVTYISSIYLHDSNLNIIGKVNLAQPTVKREEDSFIFRVKLDF